MSTGSILSILGYPQYSYHMVYHTGLSLVHCGYLSVGSLHLSPWFFTLPGISFTTPVLENIRSSILISKIYTKNPQIHTLICRHTIGLHLRLSSPNHYAKRLLLFRTVTGLFLSNENTIGPAIGLLALVLREASRDRR